ncbi:MAG TPA: DUF4446 family protein [Solirubrobacteraceae bacterium]|nr:DUF4446 family protein [Solirubrobacteraceae bacterium]
MAELTSVPAIIALAAGAVALLALAVAVMALVRLRAVRADQRAVLGEAGEQDLVGHAAALEGAFRALHDYVTEVAQRLDTRLGTVEDRLEGVVSGTGLVRYDAYNEMSGHQSTSIALLDTRATGLVLSSIHHRDQARLYVKRVHEGRGEIELSPEEHEAVRLALEAGAAGGRSAAQPAR